MIIDRPQFQIRTADGVVNRFAYDGKLVTREQAHKAAIRALGAWAAAPIWGGKSVTMVEVKP